MPIYIQHKTDYTELLLSWSFSGIRKVRTKSSHDNIVIIAANIHIVKEDFIFYDKNYRPKK